MIPLISAARQAMLMVLVMLAGLAFAPQAQAQMPQLDPQAGQYVIPPQPSADAEATRLDRTAWSDLVPLGRMAQAGDRLVVDLDDLPQGHNATLVIGFDQLWSSSPGKQEAVIDGKAAQTVIAEVDGPVYLRHIGAGDIPLRLTLTGGDVLPMYVDGAMSRSDWRAVLATHPDAPFVQLLGARAIITLPASVYATDPVRDPAASFAAIDRMLGWQDDLSGLDGRSARDMPSPNRVHYLVDFTATAAERDQFYMYATAYFVGMLPDNTADLTDPDRLAQEWAIWHETGHLHQQNSWTWGALTEVNVNLYSLFVQEKLGLPSRLDDLETDVTSTRARAQAYLNGPVSDYLADTDDPDVFIKLVMLDQLRATYGWDLFRQLNRAIRATPLDADASDDAKAQHFIVQICTLTGHDLRGFFNRWGLLADTVTNRAVAAMRLPALAIDPASLF